MATKSDLHWAKKSVEIPNNVSKDNVVRLRGIPYGATKQDVAEFFNGTLYQGFHFNEYCCA